MDLERVKALLAEGADVQARNESESTPLIFAAETFAYVSAGKDESDRAGRLKAAQAVIEYLIAQGADASSRDGRGMNAFEYLLTYADPVLARPITEMILDQPLDLSSAGHDDGYTTAHHIARGRAFFSWAIDRLVRERDRYKLNFEAKTLRGHNILHLAATRMPLADGRLRLKEFAELLPAPLRALYADMPDETQSAPLVWAISTGNAKAVRYLLDTYPIDVNRATTEGETPLDIAVRLNSAEIVELLKSSGGRAAERPAGIVCDRANASPLDIGKLKAIVATCRDRIRSLDDVLPLLPLTFRSNYSLVYKSRSLQGATFANPRAILFERNARLIGAFNGDPAAGHYQSLEVMAYDPQEKIIELFEFDFSRAKEGLIKVSGPNPSSCVGCHSRSPRPNWEAWSSWAGVYHGDMLNQYPREKAWFDTYEKNRLHHGRYRHLMPESLQPMDLAHGIPAFNIPGASNGFGNLKMDSVVDTMMGYKLAAELKAEPLRPYRYAILGALTCEEPVAGFMPTGRTLPHMRTLEAIVYDVEARAAAQQSSKFRFQASAIDGGFVGRYAVESLLSGSPYGLEIVGDNYEIKRIANLRYLLEGLLGDGAIAHWGTQFGIGNNYVFASLSHVEAQAWKELLDPAADRAIYRVYEDQARRLAGSARVFNWIYRGGVDSVAKPLCDQLRAASLRELKSAAGR